MAAKNQPINDIELHCLKVYYDPYDLDALQDTHPYTFNVRGREIAVIKRLIATLDSLDRDRRRLQRRCHKLQSWMDQKWAQESSEAFDHHCVFAIPTPSENNRQRQDKAS